MTGINTSCGACKFLRRKCTKECVFAPYFRYDEGVSHFGAIHKVFGASNVSRLLLHLPEQHRNDAAFSIAYEALARMHDPVYGCVSHIYALQQQVTNLQEEIDVLSNQMANNLTTGVTSDYCELLQATNDTLINNLSHFSEEGLINPNIYSNIQHQHYPDIFVDEAKYWDVMNKNYEQEAVVPIYQENKGACGNKEFSNETSMQNLCNYIYDPYYHEKVLDDVFNQEMFFN